MPPPHSVKIKCLFVSLPTVRSTPDIELEWKTNTQIKYKSTCCFTDRDIDLVHNILTESKFGGWQSMKVGNHSGYGGR